MYDLFSYLCQPLTLLTLLALVVVASFWVRPPAKRRRLLLLTMIVLVLAAISTTAVGDWARGSLEALSPPLAERPDDVEAIVVLGGGYLLADGMRQKAELTADSLYRCLHAAELYHQGEPCRVIVSGGRPRGDEAGPAIADVMRDCLVQQRVDPADVILEDRSTTTYENALFSQELLQEMQVDKVLLVTDARHMLRSRLVFEALGLEVVAAPCHCEATPFQWRIDRFLPSTDGIEATEAVVHEWIGLAWYWCRGRL